MEIRMKNIGIVENSFMILNGLTVITGKNNSGKTTVGKTLYSILDAVSNISAKAKNDRVQYITRKLDEVEEVMNLFRFLVPPYFLEKENMGDSVLSNWPSIYLLFSHDYKHEIPQNEMENFAHKVNDEIYTIDVENLSRDKRAKLYTTHFSKNGSSTERIITEQLNKAKEILAELFSALAKDPQLVDFARESINQTLKVEFSGQIQPAKKMVDRSKIELYDNNLCCFNIDINENRVVNDNKPVFFTAPYQRVYLVDNPFVLDDNIPAKRFAKKPIVSDYDGFLNPSNIISHNSKLRFVLKEKTAPTILEQTILDESLEKIKEKIDEIIPGAFEFSSSGDYYIQNGTKLRVSNLATGSKMFSIIKILLEKGELDQSTMLILDEPEAHLHPSWQNCFAEMIVMLVKELKVNILLTTHSSNFVLALDAYMRKHSIEENTNFYCTQFTNDEMVDYVCTNDNIGAIYEDFLQYLSEAKVLRNTYLKDIGGNND